MSDSTSRRAIIGALGAAPFLAASLQAQPVQAPDRSAQLNLHDFGAVGDGRTDDTQALAAAVAAIGRLPAGGTLFIPKGTYRLSAQISLPRYITLAGEGPVSSKLLWTHRGHGLRKAEPLNGSHNVFVTLEKLAIHNDAAANEGAGFYDSCGTQIVIKECTFSGWRFSIILDQSELVDIDLCELASAGHSGLWLVNGPDLDRRSQGGFTNRISMSRCQISSCAQFGILDDGGYAHAFVDNNYNGCRTHIRAAGVAGLAVRGGEFEGAAGASIVISPAALAGRGVGQNASTLIAGAMLVPSPGNPAIDIAAAAFVTLIGNAFGNTGDRRVPLVRGTANCAGFFSAGNAFFGSEGPFVDGEAEAAHFSAERLRKGSVTAPAGRLAPGAARFVDVPVPGIALGDHVDSVSTSVDLGDDVTLSGRVSKADTVRLRIHNGGAAPATLVEALYRVRASKH